jgi:hypothetical protein
MTVESEGVSLTLPSVHFSWPLRRLEGFEALPAFLRVAAHCRQLGWMGSHQCRVSVCMPGPGGGV